MRVLMILPALTEAVSPFFRPIKYSLFPPLGLASLASHLDRDHDEVEIIDEHTMPPVRLDRAPDPRPNLVVIQTYITNAKRCYRIADHFRLHGCRVALGGLHASSLPQEACRHADHLFSVPATRLFRDSCGICEVANPRRPTIHDASRERLSACRPSDVI